MQRGEGVLACPGAIVDDALVVAAGAAGDFRPTAARAGLKPRCTNRVLTHAA